MYKMALSSWPLLGRLARLGRARSWGRNFNPNAKKRRASEIKLVESSSLFDRDWYLQAYPDVAKAGIDPLVHYMDTGWREGRDPGPAFAGSSYLKAHADVARSGVNPLLHFIQFGYAEGRETFGRRAAVVDRPKVSFDFADPAPCASFPVVNAPPVLWRRAYRLDSRNDNFLAFGNCGAGYVADPDIRERMNAAFALFELLSGNRAQALDKSGFSWPEAGERMIDAWYVNSTQLRTRWNGEQFPFVLRAFQKDPLHDEVINLVGEGFVSSPLDIIDLHLRNPFFPLLFAVAEPTGELRGARLLAFPSLCRGGLHYPELLCSPSQAGIVALDVLKESNRLADRLLRLVYGDIEPAISAVQLDRCGADGTERLFQPDLKLWLEKVIHIRLTPTAGEDCSSGPFATAGAVSKEKKGGRLATLVLRHDMVPTIAALTEPRASERSTYSQAVPLLVASTDPDGPVILIELPGNLDPGLETLPEFATTRWPRIEMPEGEVPQRFPAGAIRLGNAKRLTDAELLVPTADGNLASRFASRQAITWLIKADGWTDGTLVKAIYALALQCGMHADSIAFIGSADPLSLSVAIDRFGGRVRRFVDVASSAREIETPLVGFLGAGVVLHDNRSVAVFSTILENDAVATASCVLITSGGRNSIAHLAVLDSGITDTNAAFDLARPEHELQLEHLWRTNYPVAEPLRDLWVTRSEALSTWLSERKPASAGERIHICSSLITASYCDEFATARFPKDLPGVAVNSAVRAEVLFG
jgi:hypothetical protein